MDDDDEGRVDLVGQALEERLQRMHAAGRGPDADGREPLDSPPSTFGDEAGASSFIAPSSGKHSRRLSIVHEPLDP